MENLNTYPREDEEIIVIENTAGIGMTATEYRNRKPRELKLAKEEVKVKRSYSLSASAIDALDTQAKYFHKNFSETLERIIFNSLKEITELEESKTRRKSVKELEGLIAEQAEMLKNLYLEIEKLKKPKEVEDKKESNLEEKVNMLENVLGALVSQTIIPRKEQGRTEEQENHLTTLKNIILNHEYNYDPELKQILISEK